MGQAFTRERAYRAGIPDSNYDWILAQVGAEGLQVAILQAEQGVRAVDILRGIKQAKALAADEAKGAGADEAKQAASGE